MSMNLIRSPYPSGVGSSFNPGSYLAGYDFDINPEAVTGADGDPVVDAPDVSGGGWHYGQNTTLRQPTIKRGIYNGHDAIRFGVDKCLVPDPTAYVFGPHNTFVCICTPSVAAEYIVRGNGGEGGPAIISGFAAAFEYFYASGAHERATFASSASGAHILTICRSDDTGNYTLYFNQTQLTPVAVNTNDDWDVRSLDTIGAFTRGSSNYGGDLLRLFHFSQNHAGTSGLTALLAAAKIRWGTP